MGSLWRGRHQAESAGDWSCKGEGSCAADRRLHKGAQRRAGKWEETLGTQSTSLASTPGTTANPACDLVEQPHLRFPRIWKCHCMGWGTSVPGCPHTRHLLPEHWEQGCGWVQVLSAALCPRVAS